MYIKKGKKKKGIIIIKHKGLNLVMFCDSSYATKKETRISVSGLVEILRGILLTCLSKTQSTITLISIEAEYVEL